MDPQAVVVAVLLKRSEVESGMEEWEEEEEEGDGEIQLRLGVPDVAVAVGKNEVDCATEEEVLAGVMK